MCILPHSSCDEKHMTDIVSVELLEDLTVFDHPASDDEFHQTLLGQRHQEKVPSGSVRPRIVGDGGASFISFGMRWKMKRKAELVPYGGCST